MNKLFTRSTACSQPKTGGNFLDLPGTRVWWDEPTSNRRRSARLPGTARYAALAAFVAAGGAVLATWRRRMNHGA
jgi:hypothetical protein